MKAKVNWYKNDVMAFVTEASEEALVALGFAIEGQAKANIVANDQVDTGFMLNSGYVIGGDVDTYSFVDEDDSKSPEAIPPDNGAVVAFAADYALFQEMRNSFLYKAVDQVAGGRADTIIKEVAKGKTK